jgi:hypothetical protein
MGGVLERWGWWDPTRHRDQDSGYRGSFLIARGDGHGSLSRRRAASGAM